MPVPYPNKDISARDDNGSRSIGYKDADGKFRAVSATDPLPLAIINPLTGETAIPAESARENTIPSLCSVPWQVVGITDIFDVSLGNGDIVTAEGNMNGARYIKISQSPFNAGTETTLTSKETHKMPFVVDSALSISTRLVGVESAFGVIGTDASGTVETLTPPSDIAISGNIAVAANVWTINTATAHGLVPNDRIILIGNTDSRLNVWPVLVTAVTSATSLTITSTLANAVYTAGGSIEVVDPMRFAVNGANFIFDTATVTQAINSSRNDGNSKFQNPVYAVSTTAISGTPAVRSESMLPTSKYALEMYPDYNYYSNIAVDSVTAIELGIKRTNQIPNGSKNYKVRYRCRNNSNFSTPIGRITSATKSGTTTATIVTDVPHGLTTSDFVVIQGVRDITSFPNLIAATAVTSIISPTSFTVIQGSAVTASSQDGVVFKINGLGTVANMTTTRGIQSIQAANNELTLTISGTVTATALNGDTVSVYGLAPALQSVYEGAYVVLDNSGSTIILRPINTDGSVRTIADIDSTPTGGMYIRRVDYIIHWTRVKKVSRQSVEIVNGDSIMDVSRATKAYIMNPSSIPVASTQSTGIGTTIWQVGWYSGLLVVDVASAAITTTATTAAIQPGLVAWVGAYANQFNVVVTAMSGTNPTLDVVIEESMDAGTNWQPIYHFPRITANGIYPTPLIRSSGTRFRYVQTVAGTTPSFTRAINRVMYSSSAPIIRNFIDRSIVLTTLNSTSPIFNIDSTDKVQFSIAVGAITTTAPQVQLEVSDDGVNFALVGTPVTAVASSTVRSAVLEQMGKFARVRVTTAGVGVTANFINIKAIWL